MRNKHFTVLLPLLVILTILASLITPAPAQAANTAPPYVAAGEPPPPPGEKAPKSPAAPDNPVPPSTDNNYTAEIPVDMPVGAPDGVANSAAAALSVDAIAQAGAVLVGPDGRILPLAAQVAAGILVSHPVYFKGSTTLCSGGVCEYDSITSALADFLVNKGTGMILVTGPTIEPVLTVDVDGTALGLSKLTGLAWDASTPYSASIPGGLLTIQNMLKGFTVQGFSIGQGIDAHDNAGTLRLLNLWVTNPSGHGIYVHNHKGNIDLFNVTVSEAIGTGAWLDNSAGTGNITISNSLFDKNTNGGLRVNTNGSALLDRVEGSNSAFGDGANLTVKKGATVKNSIFDNNAAAGSGLVINGSGALSLQNVEALNNQGKGLWLSTDNNITLTNIQSLNNPDGVTLDNSSAATPKTVTVNNGVFNDSTTGYGLEVKSRGSITLNHIDAEGNFTGGIILDNGVTYLGSGSVSVLNTLGPNLVIDNDGLGLNVFSKGAITVKGVYASGNVGGLSLDGCASTPPDTCLGKGSVTLSAVTVENNLGTLNTDNGLMVRTGGAISLDGTSFTGNAFGVVLDNSPVTTAKTVTVKNSSFNNTSDPTSVGLVVKSKGSITLNHVVASSNLGYQVYGPDAQYVSGILLDNCLLNAGLCTGSGKVSVLNSLGLSEAQDNNQGDGLFILSKAAISITGFSSIGNGGGAYINNALGSGAVSITNSAFSNNAEVTGGLLTGAYGGLVVRSTRGITLNGVEASENDSGAGADLSNEAGLTTSDAVTINKSHFDHNTDSGLLATAKGSLTLNNVSVNYNNADPANDGAAILRSVNGGITILDKLGPNQFNYNQNNGLVITADNGAISLTGVTASDNSTGTDGIGMILANASATTARPITVQKTVTSNNYLGGLDITSKGVVTLNGVQADSNANGWGVHIDNCVYIGFCEGSGGVSILSTLGANSMSYNRFGMQIFSAGSVAINGTSASHNLGSSSGKSGVWIDNHYTPGKTITVNKSNFDSNSGTGVYLVSAGAITLNNISASHNVGGSGVEARNPGAVGDAGVSILSTLGINQFNGNSGNGINVFTDGNIVLNKVMVSDNGFIVPNDGAILRTINASSVTITCSVFNHNQGYGLSVTMGTGPVIFKSVGANKNLGPADYDLPPLLVPTVSWVVCGH